MNCRSELPFHPLIGEWFAGEFGEPTDAQRAAWPSIAAGKHTLLLSPTGSGKTLAAFLVAIDRLLFSDRNASPPIDNRQPGVSILYISPLKALGVDVQKNLALPLRGIQDLATRREIPHCPITVGVRSGDTSPADRRDLVRHPPNILITTPESLFLILTSRASQMLTRVKGVIIDEIHTMVAGKRGAHLFVSLERLEQLVHEQGGEPFQRIGLSATQRPLDEVARLLGGAEIGEGAELRPRHVEIVDVARQRPLELRVEVPVDDMAHLADGANGKGLPSIWPSVHRRLLDLIRSHRSTMVFVNNRRLAERLATSINELAREEIALAHHGSIAKDLRAQIEDRLKQGTLPAIIATNSLELGIDMGAVDLVIQIESPPSIASGLQRIGRSGHQVGGTSTGVIFPKHRNDLLACAAAANRMLEGEVESSYYPRNPLDVLAQQLVAIVSQQPTTVDNLYHLVRRAAPFHELSRDSLERVLDLIAGRYPSTEFSNLRARVNWNRTTQLVTPRRSAQRLAVTNGGTIPDRGLYGVFLAGADKPQRVGELDEEMVFETVPGEVFLLGASAWRVEEVTHDRVLVTPAPGEVAKMPFWHGDGPGRDYEFGQAIGRIARELVAMPPKLARARLERQHHLDGRAAKNLVAYLHDQAAATQFVPSDRTIVIEAFPDEVGDWRVAILTPFGSRVHAPWSVMIRGMLRRASSTECDSVWTDDGIMLRLPDANTVPSLESLLPRADGLRDCIATELGGTAMFAARFRENAARSLLLPRNHPGKRTPLWLQRRKSADLLQIAANYEDFPIVLETYRECLCDVFDLNALTEIARDIASKQIRVHHAITERASPFATSILFNYTASHIYGGDAPLAEQRARSLTVDHGQLRSLIGEREVRSLLDAESIEHLTRQLQCLSHRHPLLDVDELHDLIQLLGDLTFDEIVARAGGTAPNEISELIRQAESDCHIVSIEVSGELRYIAIEDAGRYRDAFGSNLPHGIPAPFLASTEQAVSDVISRFARRRGPFTASVVASRYGIDEAAATEVLDALQRADRLVAGDFLPDGAGTEWCDRGVLRQLKRRSLEQLRKEIEPVDSGVFARFMPVWQGIEHCHQGLDGILDVVEQLQGLTLPASVWERDVFRSRVENYCGDDLDELCAAGEIVWQGNANGTARDGGIAFYLTDSFSNLSHATQSRDDTDTSMLRRTLSDHGPLTTDELIKRTRRFRHDVMDAIWRLVWAGELTNDSFALVRQRIGHAMSAGQRVGPRYRSRRQRATPLHGSNRWRLLPRGERAQSPTERQVAVAQQLAKRYGVVTRELVAQEGLPGGFSGVYPVYKALEESGRLRRGYFIDALGPSQFAVPGGAERLRGLASDVVERPQTPLVLSACDPAQIYGVVLPWPVVPKTTVRPRRDAGAYVMLVNGEALAYLNRGHNHVLTFGARCNIETDLPAVVAGLAEIVARHGPITIERWNGQSTNQEATVQLFRPFGILGTSKGLIVRPVAAHK